MASRRAGIRQVASGFSLGDRPIKQAAGDIDSSCESRRERFP